jgi:hypothetical protein
MVLFKFTVKIYMFLCLQFFLFRKMTAPICTANTTQKVTNSLAAKRPIVDRLQAGRFTHTYPYQAIPVIQHIQSIRWLAVFNCTN